MFNFNERKLKMTKKTKKNTKPLISKKSLFKSKKSLEKGIEDAIRNVGNVNPMLQKVLCSVVLHIEQYKDLRVLNNLYHKLKKIEGFNKSSRVKVFFLKTLENVDFNGSDFVRMDKNRPVRGRLGIALETKWWTCKPPKETAPIDAVEAVDKLLEKLRKRVKKKLEGDNIPDELLILLTETVARYREKQLKKAA